MSRRNFLRPHQIFSDIDSTTNPESSATDVSGLDNIMHLFSVDAGVRGELFVEFSLDHSSPSNWHELSFGNSVQLIIDGSLETIYSTNIKNPGFKFLRLRFVDNAGSGDINGFISGTSVGA